MDSIRWKLTREWTPDTLYGDRELAMSGIISYLKEGGLNVHLKQRVTPADLGAGGAKTEGICWEFREMRAQPTHYTIKIYATHSPAWRLGASSTAATGRSSTSKRSTIRILIGRQRTYSIRRLRKAQFLSGACSHLLWAGHLRLASSGGFRGTEIST
jgi:hypothetical protein